jgi:hypothetical protein
MTKRQKVLWAVVALFVLICLAAVSTPNLLRWRMAADEASLIGKLHSAKTSEQRRITAQMSLYLPAAPPDKKLIHSADLGLVVGDVRASVERLRRLTESAHGEIDKVEITQTSGGSVSATLVVRVPASGLQNALAEFKKVAVRTEREEVGTRDVTREFYDNEAHMRNLQAEEQQYLAIMKQAHTVKDTLDV